jgi:hypothetical protein
MGGHSVSPGGVSAWHARGQGFKSPQLHSPHPQVNTPTQRLPSYLPAPLRVLGARLGHGCQGGVQVGLHGFDHQAEHCRGAVPVVCPNRGRVELASTAGTVAHQLIDEPGRDAAGLWQRRERRAKLVRAMQDQPRERGQADRPLVDAPVVASRQVRADTARNAMAATRTTEHPPTRRAAVQLAGNRLDHDRASGTARMLAIVLGRLR